MFGMCTLGTRNRPQPSLWYPCGRRQVSCARCGLVSRKGVFNIQAGSVHNFICYTRSNADLAGSFLWLPRAYPVRILQSQIGGNRKDRVPTILPKVAAAQKHTRGYGGRGRPLLCCPIQTGVAKPGLLGWMPTHAVTFLDNHDTGSTQAHWCGSRPVSKERFRILKGPTPYGFGPVLNKTMVCECVDHFLCERNMGFVDCLDAGK